MENLIEREHDAIFQTYKRYPIVAAKAKGCTITDNQGNEYLDMLAGIAVNALGHGHPAIIDAIHKQADKYMHISNYFYQEPQILLAEKLKILSGCDKVFFTNSGTEATDGAMKLIRRWGSMNNKHEIAAFSGGFHGRTYGALSIMDKPLYKDQMGPYLEGTRIIKFNDISALEAGINGNTAGVFLEFIQGEGGICSPSIEFVKRLHELRDKFGFLIVADEIQAGAGRTGKFFGFEHFGAKPDIITMAKGIGGGLPLGAILAKKELASIWEKGNHGTTYGGNALACATGLAVLQELENCVMQNVQENGAYLKEKLNESMNKYPDKILEVRGYGLMLGLQLSFDASLLANALIEKRVIANAASGTVLRIVPPLILTKSEADTFADVLDVCLASL